MTSLPSKTIYLKAAADNSIPGPDNFEIRESKVNTADLKEGEIVVTALVMSVDPFLRGQIKTGGSKKVGEAMVGFVAGKVLASKHTDWKENDLIGASANFSTVQILNPSKTIAWNVTDYVTEDKISYAIGVLGMPGSTAYGGLLDVLRPEEGQTIFVSGAAGAVGSMVGQIAKRVKKCTVIGSCGGPEKCKLVKEKFGFDHCIDYKTVSNTQELKAELKKVAPGGIDMYFENVGGMHFEAAFESLRPHGRIAVCGGISQYNKTESDKLKINPLQMIYSFQRIEGFVCIPWLSGKKGNFLKDMYDWVQAGHITVEETVFEGIENWPVAFQGLFTGKNKGKAVVKL